VLNKLIYSNFIKTSFNESWHFKLTDCFDHLWLSIFLKIRLNWHYTFDVWLPSINKFWAIFLPVWPLDNFFDWERIYRTFNLNFWRKILFLLKEKKKCFSCVNRINSLSTLFKLILQFLNSFRVGRLKKRYLNIVQVSDREPKSKRLKCFYIKIFAQHDISSEINSPDDDIDLCYSLSLKLQD